jgi:hypothetical protein
LCDHTVLYVKNVIASYKRLHTAGKASVGGHIDVTCENGTASGTGCNISTIDVVADFCFVSGVGSHDLHRQKDWVFVQVGDRTPNPTLYILLADARARQERRRDYAKKQRAQLNPRRSADSIIRKSCRQ